MTVVAYKDGVLASDTLLSDGDGNKLANCNKIKRVKGWLIGAHGDFGPTEAFLARFNPNNIKKRQFVRFYRDSLQDRDEFDGLIVSPAGKIYQISSNGVFGPVHTYGYYAIGCGAMVALGAMAAGANASQAVRICMKHAEGCGGRVEILKLKGIK